MAIETNAVVISDLNENYPQDRDYIAEGAAHMRLTKKVLKNTFPNVNSPVDIDSDTLNIFSNKITITGDYMDVGGLMIKNSTPGTASNDVVVKSQMETYFTDFLKNRLYRVGSYFISEDDTNPGDSAVLGFGTWVQVTGMLMGSGTVNPDGSVPNAQRRDFVRGSTGGRVYNTIKVDNLPLVSIDLAAAGVTTSEAGGHVHQIKLDSIRISIDNQNSLVYRVGSVHNQAINTESAGVHTHPIRGTISFGKDDISRQPIDTMPPYRVANIWRRTV